MNGGDHDGYTNPEAVVIEKTQYRDRWNELVIRWGPVEYLVMAAYCVRRSPASVVTSQRYLRNYCKHDSARLWSYNSQSFSDAGFYPTHPLAIDHHTARARSKYKDKASLASLVLNLVISRHLTSHHRQAALTILESTKEFSHISTTEWARVSTIEEAVSIFERTVPSAGILHPLRILNKLDILPQSEHCRISHLLNDTNIVDDIREMYNQPIANTFKSCNKKNAQATHKAIVYLD
ncbi:hypothetical protein O0I10_005729 [Lichtheimia ornata]|uniref:Uncharacterized protein n=1 Tax=Lichtheimia ornata TaxID=688661 RepID=A0AAD7V3L8_9FUNG|nr:uncharacterized protein O0I10_005729 [Lichtheimia ornata]KAJ8658689.1 hypothetical protein O0I10_005729 [Lichtheimia ornata]